MMLFKNHDTENGFILTEVLLALMVIAIALTPMLGLQSSVIRSIVAVSGRVQRIFLSENFLLSSREKLLAEEIENGKREKKISDPKTILIYEAKKPGEETIAKKFKGIMQEETETIWQEGLTKRSDIIVSFVYKSE